MDHIKQHWFFDTFEVISRVCNKIGNNDKPVCIKKLQKFDVKFTKFGYFVRFFHCWDVGS